MAAEKTKARTRHDYCEPTGKVICFLKIKTCLMWDFNRNKNPSYCK